MNRIILGLIFSCVFSMSSLVGQCTFPSYDNYGLICDEAKFLCGSEMDGYSGRLLSTKSPLPQPHPLCGLGVASGSGEADNIQWFSFLAASDSIRIRIQFSNCTGNIAQPGLQVGILGNCVLNADTTSDSEIFCAEQIGYSEIVLLPNSSLVEVGQIYYLFVDGYAGSACDFTLFIDNGICTDAPSSNEPCPQDCGLIAQFPDNIGCTQFNDIFTFEPSTQILDDLFGCNPDVSNVNLDSIICIEWEILPNIGFDIISENVQFFDSLDIQASLEIEWLVAGTYTIRPILNINPLFSTCKAMCDCTANLIYSIDITESDVIVLPVIQLCPGECSDFCGQTACTTETITCLDRNNCTITEQPFVAIPTVDINEGIFVLCNSDCFEFQGQNYCNTGQYAIVNSSSCDTVHLFEIVELDLSIDLIPAGNLIDCDTDQLILEGNWSTNFTGNILTVWLSENGDTLSQSKDYIATEGGVYTFSIWPEDMKSCGLSITHLVIQDDGIPEVEFILPQLNCDNPISNIIVQSVNSLASVSWTGPNGITSNDFNLEVSEGGNYVATVTASNGCKITKSMIIPANFQAPNVSVTNDDFDCTDNLVLAEFTSNMNIRSQEWKLPTGELLVDKILVLKDPGIYELVVTADNGCTALAQFEVLDFSYDPSLGLNEDAIWRCKFTEIEIDLSAYNDPKFLFTWTTLEGAFLNNGVKLSVTKPGVYVLTTEDKFLNCVGHDTVRIIDDPNPFLDLTYSIFAPTCAEFDDGIIEIVAFNGGEGPFEFSLDGQSFIDDMANLEIAPGMHRLEIRDAFGCTIMKDIEIPFTPPIEIEILAEIQVKYGGTYELTFDTNLDLDKINNIEWTDQDGLFLGSERTVIIPGVGSIDHIMLRVEDENGCEASAIVRVVLDYEVEIFYPNVFSPNADGTNDHFVLFNNGLPEIMDDVRIFDRSGELVYQINSLAFNEVHIGWDGTFNGKNCNPGVYVFMVKYTLADGTNKTFSGSITLIR